MSMCFLYARCLLTHHYGIRTDGAARPIFVEEAEGRLHTDGWEGGKHGENSWTYGGGKVSTEFV